MKTEQMMRGVARLNGETVAAQQREYNEALRRYRRALGRIRARCKRYNNGSFATAHLIEIDGIAKRALEGT